MTRTADGFEWFYSGPSGGVGGDEWHSPYFTADERLIGVDVRHGAWIDAIIVYTTANTYTFGGSGGSLDTSFRLGDNERLVRVSGTYGRYVNTLMFVVLDLSSSAYTTYGPYGQDGPATFDYEAPPGIGIAALWGRSGSYLDSIGANYLPFNHPQY